MNLSEIESFALPILGAVVAGGLIGFEREWRGRAAGFRTHILVSLASALLMLAAMGQADWAFRALPDENIVTDPTRMAHGVLTGIGFLCAGVIFRTGFSIHGLTSAGSSADGVPATKTDRMASSMGLDRLRAIHCSPQSPRA